MYVCGYACPFMLCINTCIPVAILEKEKFGIFYEKY